MSHRPFRKTGQGVLVNGEVKAEAKANARRKRGAWYEARVIGERPEAGRSMRGQVEA